MTDSSQNRLRQDLGLGGKLSERSRARLLNHDGTFNVRRNDLSPFHPYNAYHTLLSLPIPRPARVDGGGLRRHQRDLRGAVLALRAPVRWPGRPTHRWRGSRTASSSASRRSRRSATAGSSRTRTLANMLVALEALVGLLGFAILSGLLFARFTRPTAKISFSRNAIIAPYEGGWALMFRLVNLRNHDLTDVHAVVSFARWVNENGVRRAVRSAARSSATRSSSCRCTGSSSTRLPSAARCTVSRRSRWPASDPEFVCLITADDETFAQTVHSKTSYDKTDIVWGARFRDMYLADTDHVAIDLGRLHDFHRIEAPASV